MNWPTILLAILAARCHYDAKRVEIPLPLWGPPTRGREWELFASSIPWRGARFKKVWIDLSAISEFHTLFNVFDVQRAKGQYQLDLSIGRLRVLVYAVTFKVRSFISVKYSHNIRAERYLWSRDAKEKEIFQFAREIAFFARFTSLNERLPNARIVIGMIRNESSRDRKI